jgi:hypothetical protein
MREVGIHLALVTMRKGELARVRTTPQYGFGERGGCTAQPAEGLPELQRGLRGNMGLGGGWVNVFGWGLGGAWHGMGGEGLAETDAC